VIPKRFLVTASSDNEHFNADCDFVVINFSGELLRKLARLRSAFLAQAKKFKDLESWHLRDSDALFISRNAAKALLGEVPFEEMEEQYVGIPFELSPQHNVDLEKFGVSNSDEVVISADGVWWRVFPSHAEITVGSDFYSWDWFARCTHCGLRPDEHVYGLGGSQPKCTFAASAYRPLLKAVASSKVSTRGSDPSAGGVPKLWDGGGDAR
jgi:hypothetical protein